MRSAIVFVFAFFISMNEGVAQQPFLLEDYARLVNINDPQISPDGRSVLLVVSRPDYDKNIFSTELVSVEVATGKLTILVKNRSSLSYPRWSPDGSHIAFLAKASEGKGSLTQVFILPLKGDSSVAVTQTPKGVQHFSWSPDSRKIAFVTSDEPANKEKIEKGYTAFEVLNNDMFVTSRPLPAHIWTLDIASGKQKRLTSGEWSLPVTIPPGAPLSPLSWSPDGKYLLFAKVPTPYSGDLPQRTLYRLEVNTGNMETITKNNSLQSNAVYSPDGNKICYWFKKNGNSEDINQIWVAGKAGENASCFSASLDRDLYRAVWMPDGKSLIAGGHDDNKTSLWELTPDGKYRKIDLGNICPYWSFWLEISVSSNGRIAFVGTEPDRPSELYILNSPSSQPRRLTDLNKEVFSRTMGSVKTIRWQSDGMDHSGIVTYPVNFSEGKKYPLVLIIHGGPAAASVEQFTRLAQVFANKGYVVFEPNYRGSDNQGSAYRLAIVEDAGAGPGRDVMAGLEKLKSMGFIDTGRIGVSGWSYGGFMTTWLAGHYKGWSAALAGAAVTDLTDQYNFSDYNVNRANSMGGSPWIGDNKKKYEAQSPITEAGNITAPTLILANTGDPRVPITQSYKLFRALKDVGTVTKFIAWPVNLHNATDPITQMERDRYWINWMEQYLKK
jgi:dipeptidyl aminopeptidase/acylaminoacyl peptidase